MHRLFAIALLVLLPLQFSWAAVASYCGHETRSDAGHWGHHEHQHRSDVHTAADATAAVDTAAAAQPEKLPGVIDLDCGQCQGGCTAMPTPALQLPDLLPAAPPGAARMALCAGPGATRPERPQWLPLA